MFSRQKLALLVGRRERADQEGTTAGCSVTRGWGGFDQRWDVTGTNH